VAFSHVGLDWQAFVIQDERFMRPTEIAAARGNYAKAKANLGWQPQMLFQDLIRLMVDEDIRRLAVL